jgi:hypothetical protein
MMTSVSPDEAWARLVTLPEREREAQMRARYLALATLSEEEERRTRLRRMAESEYALTDDHLRPFTLSRIRVWLDLEDETAKRISASYDAVMAQMPGPAAMRWVAIIQTLAREFPLDAQAKLRALVPNVITTDIRPLTLGAGDYEKVSVSKRAWWAFWKR